MSSIVKRCPAPSRKLGLWLPLLVLLVVLGWAIAHSEGIGGPPLVSVWAYDPEDYDPQHTSHPMAQEIFRHVCEPLFYQDEQGDLRGILAEDDIVYGSDGREVTIRLRPDIIFHDGTPLDAGGVVASFERLQQFGASPLLNELRDVIVTAGSDGRSVVFTLPYLDYEFGNLVLSNSYAVIVSPKAGAWMEPGFVACTGPYRFVPSAYRPNRSVTLVPNSNYHYTPPYAENPGPPTIRRLVYAFEPDRDARLKLLTEGSACVLSLSRDGEIPPALSHFRYHFATGGVTYLGFNFQRQRWQDSRVRAAIAMAIDKEALATRGLFDVAETPLTPESIGYDAGVARFGYGYDPQRSRELLSSAGFDVALEIILLIPESRTYRDLAADVQQQLAAIGLSRVRIREVPREDLLARRQDFDLLVFDYAWGDYTALGIFLGSGPRNLLNYPEGNIADLIAQARMQADKDERRDMILEAQKIVLSEAIWQPLLVRRIVFAVDSRCVSGERSTPFGELIFWDAHTDFSPF
ncbi:MAG: ABC transporter substrate-binding protein [Anaerolineae bacterium]|nr:ABC transporter substrate-binding protein [Anaerolineae bacterium]